MSSKVCADCGCIHARMQTCGNFHYPWILNESQVADADSLICSMDSDSYYLFRKLHHSKYILSLLCIAVDLSVPAYHFTKRSHGLYPTKACARHVLLVCRLWHQIGTNNWRTRIIRRCIFAVRTSLFSVHVEVSVIETLRVKGVDRNNLPRVYCRRATDCSQR